jgi:hypothetical protein
VIPAKVAFGTRYSDNSGWERFVEVDTHEERVLLDISGGRMCISTEEAWWLLATLIQARESLGMDKLASRPDAQGDAK